jgi:5,10-methylenetetrahydromethanopterin reductase
VARATFGLRIPPCASPTEVAGCVRDAEDAGFDIAWLPDSQFLWRDVWSCLALSATASERILLGTCVTNFETRHASVTAAAVATIEELAPARTILGVGTGDSSIKTLGLRPTRLGRMREQIELVRALHTGEAVEFEGRTMHLKAAPGRPTPIYLAATGPKALALAGEIADGVIVLAGLAPELIEKALAHIAEGAARAGRRLEDVEICLGTFCHVTSDERVKARIVKPYVVGTAQVGGREALRAVGIDVDPPQVVGGIYPDMSHAEDWDAAADAAGEWVTDEMGLRYADAFCLVGTAEYCVEQLEATVELGIDNFYIRHFESYTLPHDLLESFGNEVIPHFAA